MSTRYDKRKIQQARAKWRLCAAAEVVFAQKGARAIVADILKLAGMSRRSFYEFYRDIEDIEYAIIEHRARSGIGPRADWMVPVRTPADELVGKWAGAAFAGAREAAKREPLPVPAEDVLLAWFEKRPLPVAEGPEAAPSMASFASDDGEVVELTQGAAQ